MSETNPVGGEELIEEAYGAYSVLKDYLPETITFTPQAEDDFIMCALKRHGEHLSTHAIDQNKCDPLKLLCWIGGAIIDQIQDPTLELQSLVLSSLIRSLENMLMLETGFYIRLSPGDREFIHRLAMEEIRGNSQHGIGFNGLFLAFHEQRATYNSLNIIFKFPPFPG